MPHLSHLRGAAKIMEKAQELLGLQGEGTRYTLHEHKWCFLGVILSAAKNLKTLREARRFFTPLRSVQNDREKKLRL